MRLGTSGGPAEAPTTAASAPSAAAPETAPEANAPADPPAPEATTPWADGPAWLADVTWLQAIVALLVLVLLVAGVWLLVRWLRGRSAGPREGKGPSLARRLRSVWAPFYTRIPRQARHYPTFVVMGEAGVGKSHLIDSRVDWRGQANRFNPSATRDPVLQLYLGSEVVVHELSAPLLRDVSSAAKRALGQLWRELGPSATVVVVLDARTLATTPPAELQALAQRVCGKIGLFPRRVSESIDVRVCLTHLDQVEGYEEFAAVVGTHERGLDLALLGASYRDAERLVAAFDAHLAHALTTRSADEFTRLVRFYDALAALVGRLHPLLSSLRGDRWTAGQHAPSELYLGSIVPHSYVGDPFEADAGLVVSSIGGYNRRTIAGAAALAVGCLAVLGGLAGWHLLRIGAAEAAVAAHDRPQDNARGASRDEREAAEGASTAIGHMLDSEVLWLRWVQIDRKRAITDAFEKAIRESYLLPWLDEREYEGYEGYENGADRVELLYAVSLIYATRDGALGRHIEANARWWAKSLDLTEQMVTDYIRTSRVIYSGDVGLPQTIDQRTGREWIEYQEQLCDALGRDTDTFTSAELLGMQEPLVARSKAEYEALEGARKLLLADDALAIPFQAILGELDAARATSGYGQMVAVSEAVIELTKPLPAAGEGWGLASLVAALRRIDEQRAHHRELSVVVDDACGVEHGTAASMMARTHASAMIEAVLEAIPSDRMQDGRSFFDESEQLADVGAVRGYGGGATETIPGYYTKAAFEDHVAPVLRHAAAELPELELEPDDRTRMERAVKGAVATYASAYRNALVTYYLGFEFDPGSKVALPFAQKALAQPSSWFTDFLTTVSRNAALPLIDDEYHAPLRSALEVFEPLVALLAEEDGAIAGLEPYAAIITGLLPLMDGTGAAAAAPAGDGLEERLSGLGRLVLDTLHGKEIDRRAQVVEWLEGAQLDYEWHRPFELPVELVYRYGARDLDATVAEAWKQDVRPVVTALLAMYPFDAAAAEEVRVADLEERLRKQGEPGEFWVRFDRLLGVVTQQQGDGVAMLDGVDAPTGMLEMVEDLQDLSTTLWDADGGRIPLALEVRPQALSTKPYAGRQASMAYLSAGGSAVYAFNQRPEPQLLELKWWEQGAAIVSLTMSSPAGEDDRESTVEDVGSTFAFYRLLDQARSCTGKGCAKRSSPTPTQDAIAKGTRCGRGVSRGTTDLLLGWSVPVDDAARVWRPVRFVLVSDPWEPFAVRDCR